jgi:hypothetical protein
MEPEKQPLLAKGSKIAFLSRQRLGKHVPAVMDKYGKIYMFSIRSVQRGYKEDNLGNRVSVREAVKREIELAKLKNPHC